jgi:MIP family channel proteins
MEKYDQFRNNVALKFHSNREPLRIFFAEFLGTLFLVALGDGAVAQFVLSRNPVVSTFLTVNFAYALAIAFGVYICGGVSGGHINPAVTLCMCVFGRCDWIKLPFYWLGQFLGAFMGSAVIFTVYYPGIVAFDLATRNTSKDDMKYWVMGSAGIFGTYPAEHMKGWIFAGFYDQFVGTAILLLCVFAITDPRNMGVPKYLVPLLVGLVVGVIGMSYGWNCGYAINPARDLAPRLFTLIAQWGPETFSVNNYSFFWAPILGPFLGALFGAFIYQALIGIHWPTTYEIIKVIDEPRGQVIETVITDPKGKIVVSSPL